MSCGVGCRPASDPTLLWLWCRPVAIALIGPLAWEPPYAEGVALKRKNKIKCEYFQWDPRPSSSPQLPALPLLLCPAAHLSRVCFYCTHFKLCPLGYRSGSPSCSPLESAAQIPCLHVQLWWTVWHGTKFSALNNQEAS